MVFCASCAAVSTTHTLPLPLAAHTVESLHAEHGRPTRGVYWFVLVGALAALAALPFVEVDVSVGVPGIVRPAAERVELRLAFGGRVARVLVRDNDHVVAGQALLELATPDLDERLARNATLQREKAAAVALLDSLSTARLGEPDVLPDVTSGRAVELFSSLQTVRQEAAQLRAQLEASRVAEARARTELARVSAMAAKGIATQRELDDARYAVERVRAEAKLAVEQMRTHWHARREETALALVDLASERTRLEAERAHAIVRAPSAGALQGFVGLSEGVTVGAGQVVGAISPDDRLVVEALVSPREIGLVHCGQSVRLQVDAFPYTQWGLLDAIVMAIAADVSLTGAGGAPVFKVTIEPERAQLQLANGAIGRLGKGMTVSARLLTTRRTLLQILYQDASEWLDPQNRAAAPRT